MDVALERLLGRKVIDADGRGVGRIEEVHAERDGRELVVTGYVLGAAGWIERLSLGPLVRALLGRRLYRHADRYRIAWDELDITQPEAPRLRRRLEEVARTPAGERGRRRRASA